MRHGGSAGTEARLSLRFAFDRSPAGRGLRFGRRAGSDAGAAKVRVFEDRDLDGVFSAGDTVIEDAELVVEPRARVQPEGTHTVVDQLPRDRIVGLAVNKDTLPDPYLVPATNGIRFVPRPGAVFSFDLPVVLSGEVELALTGPDGEPVAGVIAALSRCGVDDAAQIQRERSAFDGVVFFQFVKPGRYCLSAPGLPQQEIVVEAGKILRTASVGE